MVDLLVAVVAIAAAVVLGRFGVVRTWRGDPRALFVRYPSRPPAWYPFGPYLWRVTVRAALVSWLMVAGIAGLSVIELFPMSARHLSAVRSGAVAIEIGLIIAWWWVGAFGRPRMFVPPPLRAP